MIVLSSTSDTVLASLSSAIDTNAVQFFSSWRDITSTTYVAGRTATPSDDTNPVEVIGSPASSTQRVIDLINVHNEDVISATVRIWVDDGGTEYTLWQGTLAAGETLTYTEAGWSVSAGTSGYTLGVQALTSSPTDAQTVYFGALPKAPTTTANISKVYIPKSGRIKRAEIYCYSGTAGTAESWSLYVRVNNTTDYLIAALTVAASERIFSNSSLDIVVSAGDYIEIKGVQPAWATNPLTTIYGGHIYIE